MDLLGVPGTILAQGGAGALLAFVVLAIVRGWLVPRRTLEDARGDWARQLAAEQRRGDEWRKAAEAQDTRNDVQAHQLEQLLETGRTTNALIEGLKQASERRQ